MYYSLTGEQVRHIYILKGRALDPPLLYKWSEALVRGTPVGGGAVDVSLVIRACRRRRASRNAWGLSLRFCSLRE